MEIKKGMDLLHKDEYELIRVVTRSAAFLIPLVTLCFALFFVEDVRDTIVGAVIGAATTASVFYFKKDEG